MREIAQSWIGSQVTPNNWEDYWLTEGLSNFFMREVLAQFNYRTYSLLESFSGNLSLWYNVRTLGGPNATYYTLHPVLHGDNPDETYNVVPFEKGFQFAWYMMDVLFGEFNMKDLMKYYVTNNSLTSINAFTGFRKTVSNWVMETYGGSKQSVNNKLSTIFYEDWIYPKGLDPTGMNNFTTTESNAAVNLANEYIALNGTGSPVDAATTYAGFVIPQ